MRTQYLDFRTRLSYWVSHKIIRLRFRLRKVLPKLGFTFKSRRLQSAYRLPKEAEIQFLQLQFIELYLISDIQNVAKKVAKISEKFNTYGHSKYNEIEEKIRAFEDRYGNDRWSLIDYFSIPGNKKIGHIEITIQTIYESHFLLSFNCKTTVQVISEIETIMRSPVHERKSFLRPKIFRLFKYRTLGWQTISPSKIINDRIRRKISSIEKTIKKLILRKLPTGMLAELSGGPIVLTGIGLGATKESINAPRSDFLKQTIPFNSFDAYVFKNDSNEILLSMPDPSWDLHSARQFFLTIRTSPDFEVPNMYFNRSGYYAAKFKDLLDIVYFLLPHFYIALFRKLLTSRRKDMLELRTSKPILRLFRYFRFKSIFESQFRYFDLLNREILSDFRFHHIPNLQNERNAALTEYTKGMKKYYFSIFHKHHKDISSDLTSTIQETIQSTLLLIAASTLILTIFSAAPQILRILKYIWDNCT